MAVPTIGVRYREHERNVQLRLELEWPPKSGRKQSFPEVDRAAWFTPAEAREKIQSGQAPFIDRLLERLQSKRAAAR